MQALVNRELFFADLPRHIDRLEPGELLPDNLVTID